MGFRPVRMDRRLHKLEKLRRFVVSVVVVHGFQGNASILGSGANFRLASRLRGEELRSVGLSRGPLRAASPCLRHLPSASLRRIPAPQNCQCFAAMIRFPRPVMAFS